MAVLIPHVGTVVNGARRWLSLGIMNFQPSELAKFAVLIYAADYMVRKMEVKERFFRAVLPMGLAVVLVGVLLLAEPDMGAFMVIVVIAMGILFLGGVNARMFFLIAALVVLAFVLIIATSEWRRERIFAYLNPWDEKHALGKGYQLSHALIAIGRGEIFGVGLGRSVEKLHWLPEAHTDFLLAVIGEEFGLVGVLLIAVTFLWLTRRIMLIGRQAIALDRVFSGLVAEGIAIWMGFQAFINMGVNLGALAHQGADAAPDELRRFGHFDESDSDSGGVKGGLREQVADEGRACMTQQPISQGTQRQRTALIMAGGTGGHIFPGLAVAQALRERGWNVRWLGAPGSMESRIVPAQGFPLETIEFSGVRGKGIMTLAFLPMRLLRAFWQALAVVRRVKPDVVVGLGGYISFPRWNDGRAGRQAPGAA